MSIILGLIMFVMGYGPVALGVAAGCGLLADFLLKAGKWKSWKCMLGSYVILSIWPIGTLFPIVAMGSAYFEGFRAAMGDAYADESIHLMNMISGWLIPASVLCTAIAALLGAYLGKGVLRKHFERAGIA